MSETGLTEQKTHKLGTWSVFVIAVSAMTPLTVVAGALPLGYGEVKEKGIPVAYVVVAAVLAIFTVGLTAMARHVSNSGAFYAYAARGLTKPAGVGTAFVALLAYNAMQIGLYGAFGVAAHNAAAIFGWKMSWIVWALLGWALVSFLGLRQIDFNARILTVLVCAEVLIVLTLDAVMVGHPAGGSVALDTLNPALIATAGGVSLLVGAVAGMVGFEAPLVYAAEARDPRRTVARAIFMTLGVAAILYGGSAWAMSVVAGPDQIIDVAARYLNDLFFVLPDPYLPTAVTDLARIFFATSLFAALLAFHHTVARYALAVAREGVLPPVLGRTRDDVPVAASVAQSGLTFVVLVVFGILALNPTTDLFFFGTVSGGLGVLALMTIASLAVVRFFRRDPRGESRWRRAVAPWIALVFLTLMLLLSVAFFGELMDSDNAVKVWLPPAAFLGIYLGGVWWGRRLRRDRPGVYAAIGTGLPPEHSDLAAETRPSERSAGAAGAGPSGRSESAAEAEPSGQAESAAGAGPSERSESEAEAGPSQRSDGAAGPGPSERSESEAEAGPSDRSGGAAGVGPSGRSESEAEAGPSERSGGAVGAGPSERSESEAEPSGQAESAAGTGPAERSGSVGVTMSPEKEIPEQRVNGGAADATAPGPLSEEVEKPPAS